MLDLCCNFSDQSKLIVLEDGAKAAKKGKWADDVNVRILYDEVVLLSSVFWSKLYTQF